MKGVIPIKYIRGYLQIEVYRGSLERFLNLCQLKGIVIWDIVRRGESLTCFIYLDDFKNIRQFIQKTHCLVHIKRKCGLPFCIERWKHRKAFFIGIFLAVFLFFFLSTYIWDIHIEGNLMYTDEMVIRFLEQEGIYQGMNKNSIDCDKVERRLKENYERMSWVSAYVSGTRLIIQIKENYGVLKVETKESKKADLVAGANGKIVSIVTRCGTPLVKKGETVQKGQVLVSGEIPIYNDNKEIDSYDYVRADADIRMQMQLDYKDCVEKIQNDRIYTGRNFNSYQVYLGDVAFKIKGINKKYEYYDLVKTKHQLKILGDFYLPVGIDILKTREYSPVKISLTKEQLKDKIEENMQNFLKNLEKNGLEVVEKDVRLYYDASVCTAKGKLVVISDEKNYAPITEHIIENKESGEANELN